MPIATTMTSLRRLHAHLLLALLLLAAVRPAQAQDGDLDPSFGTGGLVTSGVIGAANDVVIDSADRMLVAGAFGGHFSVARFNVDGSLDATFGTGGRVTTEFPGGGVAYSLVLLADGRILAAGTSNGDFALARYSADGVPDATFGVGGMVTTDFGAAETAYAVGLQPGGRIVAAGSTSGKFALARYSVEGVLDTTFGAAGLVITDINGNSTSITYDMAIYSDGRIIAVGDVKNTANNFRDWALARYTVDGALDPAFGSGGVVVDRIFAFTDNELRAVALDASERIIVVGNYFSPSDDDANELVTLRYTTSGARDASFGFSGMAISNSGGFTFCPDIADSNPELCDRVGLTAVALQSDGRIVVAGYHGYAHIANADFVVGRLTALGEADLSFYPPSFRGFVETSFGVTDRALAMALDSAGRIVVAGQTDGSMALARYFSAPPPPVACEPGFYSATGNAPCDPAPAGTFVDGAGATGATPCAVGTFQPDEGQTSCLLAPAGRYVDVEGAVAAIACALGTYQPDAGQTSCLLAGIGYYVDIIAATAASACPTGQTTLAEGSTSIDDCLTLNQTPVAHAGPNQTVIAGQTVILDGSGSSDPDGDALTYAWTLNGPGFSDETLTGRTPAFCAAVAGDYMASLVVNDGTVDSTPAEVIVMAITATAALDALLTDVEGLRVAGVLSDGQARGFSRNLIQAQRHIERAKVAEALDALAGFRQQVYDLEADGVLSAEQRAALVASVDAVTGALGAPCTNAPALASKAPLASATAEGSDHVGLGAAYPNPFNPSTELTFELPESGHVRLGVFDLLGREVARLVDGAVEAGVHRVRFEAGNLPSGTYLYRLETGQYSQTRRMVLLK